MRSKLWPYAVYLPWSVLIVDLMFWNLIANSYPKHTYTLADTCQVQCGSNSLCTGVYTDDTMYTCSCQSGFLSPTQNGTDCTIIIPSTTNPPVTAGTYLCILNFLLQSISLSTDQQPAVAFWDITVDWIAYNGRLFIWVKRTAPEYLAPSELC